jgi:hypothetical protein
MLKTIIKQSSEIIHAAFEREGTNAAARITGWLVCRSKMDGFTFLKVLVMVFVKHPRASLNQLSQTAQDLGVTISPQGIDERINPAAVIFLKDRLVKILAQLEGRREGVIKSLAGFSEVYFQDSTVISLNSQLQSVYPGVGGKASPAAIKIQLLFGFLSGQIAHWSVDSGRSADHSYAEHLEYLLPNSLLIQDLGYFCLTAFQKVIDYRAFFLTRCRQDIQVYLDTDPDQPLSMLNFLANQGPEVAAYAVHVGIRARLALRMICVRLPIQVAEERRRRLIQNATRKGHTVSARSLAFCHWNIFLTNLPEERLSLHQLLVCYSLRWQIELIFKLWKSQAAICHLTGFRTERILVELYAKLIGLVLTHFLIAPLRFLWLDQHIEISPPKTRQILQDRIHFIIPLIGLDAAALLKEWSVFFDYIYRFARKTRRNKHLSSIDRLRLADQLDVSQLYPLA